MVNKYDVVVIGAGLGGLSSAALLAKNGMSILLLERSHLPGGYATSFVRGRFEFEVSLHELSGIDLIEKRGTLYRYLDTLGVANKVKFASLDHFYRAVFPDLDITIPIGREKVESVLIDNFPREPDGIKKILDEIYATSRALSALSRGKPETAKEEVKHSLFDKMYKTWGEVVNSYVKDIKLRAALGVIWPYLGLPPSQLSYLVMATGLVSYITRGPKQIIGKSTTLANAFVEVIEENGGEIRLNCGAKKILSDDEKVKGVVTDSDEEIGTDCIVSNVNPIAVVLNLIGRDKVPQPFLKTIRSSEVSASAVGVYMGLDVTCKELGVNDFEIFYYDQYDFDRIYESRKKFAEPEGFVLAAYNQADPNFSPPGTSVIVLVSLSDAELWYKVPPARYVETKNRFADMIINKAEKYVPGLREHAEVVEVATPITFMRFTGNPGGSYLGFTYSTKDNPLTRMPQEGPFKGLYFTGAWTQPGGGYETTILSGAMVAQKILALTKARNKGSG